MEVIGLIGVEDAYALILRGSNCELSVGVLCDSSIGAGVVISSGFFSSAGTLNRSSNGRFSS